MTKPYSMLICGDIVTTCSNLELFIKKNLDRLLGKAINDKLQEADLVIANLEAPLTDANRPILKCGEPIKSDPRSIESIANMGNVVLSLANNHIMDFGDKGLKDTIESLDNANLKHFGAGFSLPEASQPLLVDTDSGRIAVISFAEHEFSIAGPGKAGANPYDPLTSFDSIRDLKKDNAFIIVLYHGGKEYYRYPSPQLQKICRKFVECGADLVVCQHSHCIGCEETHGNGTIVYGQGNFIFDSGNDEYWSTSLLLDINIGESGLQVNYVPIVKSNETVRAADESESNMIMHDFNCRSTRIKEQGFVEERYNVFAQDQLNNYLRNFVPGNGSFFFRALNKILNGRFPGAFMGKQQLANALNRIECEAHQELFIAGLKTTMEMDTRNHNGS